VLISTFLTNKVAPFDLTTVADNLRLKLIGWDKTVQQEGLRRGWEGVIGFMLYFYSGQLFQL